MPDTPPITLPTDRELLELIAVAKWHYSKGYDRPDGLHVGTHSYILVREEPELVRALFARIEQPDAWFGCYHNFRYRYVTLGEWTYWHMRLPVLINRDQITPADRPCA